MPTDRSPGAATGSAGLTIEGIVAVESPREFRISPRERLVAYTVRGRGRPPAVHALAARDRRAGHADHRVREGDRRTAVVPRRPAPGVRPGRGDLDRRGRRVPVHEGRPQARRRPRPAVVAGWPADRLHLAPTRLVAGLADRCARPASWSSAARPAPAPGGRAHARRSRRRSDGVVPGRQPDGRHGPAGARRPDHLADLDRRHRDRQERGRGGRAQPRHRRAVAVRRVAGLRVGRRRVVPGRAPLPGWPRPHHPHRRRARARRAIGELRVRPAALAGWQPGRAHRGPRRR